MGFDTNASTGGSLAGTTGRSEFPFGVTEPAVRALTAAEYFVGADPGEGSGVPLNPDDVAFDEETESILALNYDASGLPAAVHRIGVRFQDDLGRWSSTHFHDVTIFDPGTVQPEDETRSQRDVLTIVDNPGATGDRYQIDLNGTIASYLVQPGDDGDSIREELYTLLESNSTLLTYWTITRGVSSREIVIEGKTPGHSHWVYLDGNGTGQTQVLREQTARGVFPDGATPATGIVTLVAVRGTYSRASISSNSRFCGTGGQQRK